MRTLKKNPYELTTKENEHPEKQKVEQEDILFGHYTLDDFYKRYDFTSKLIMYVAFQLQKINPQLADKVSRRIKEDEINWLFQENLETEQHKRHLDPCQIIDGISLLNFVSNVKKNRDNDNSSSNKRKVPDAKVDMKMEDFVKLLDNSVRETEAAMLLGIEIYRRNNEAGNSLVEILKDRLSFLRADKTPGNIASEHHLDLECDVLPSIRFLDFMDGFLAG